MLVLKTIVICYGIFLTICMIFLLINDVKFLFIVENKKYKNLRYIKKSSILNILENNLKIKKVLKVVK